MAPTRRSTASTTSRAGGGRSWRRAPQPATSSAATQTVQFSSEGTRDPDGDPITYEWDFGDGSPASTEPNPSHTYGAVGTYRATLTVTDNTGRSGTDDVTVVVGNAAPAVEISSPLEGGFFDFGDAIAFEVTATDNEDGTVSGDHAACSRMRVQYLLGHDEHSHPITDATGCRGTIQTTGESGHGEDANVFGLISATYTDGGGLPGAPTLTGQDGLRIWPRLLQAEHFTEMRGVIVYPIPGAGGGEQVGSTEDDGTEGGVNYVAWEPVDLTGIASITVTAAAGGDGGPIEVRLDDPVTGPLLGTISVPNTGGWETRQDFELAIDATVRKAQADLRVPDRRDGRRSDAVQRGLDDESELLGGSHGREAQPAALSRRGHRDRSRGGRRGLARAGGAGGERRRAAASRATGAGSSSTRCAA